MKKINYYAELSRAGFRRLFSARDRSTGQKACLLTFVICLFTSSGVTYSTIERRVGDSTRLTTGSSPGIGLRAVLQVGATSDKSLIRFSADGQLVATGNGHGPVKIWQASTGKLIAALDGTDGQSPRAFSPTDDRLLASANLTSISLYDLKTMRLRSQIALKKLFGGLNLFGSFSPDGQKFLVYSQDKVSVWEVENGRLMASLPCKGGIFQSQFSYDSQKVLTSCHGERTVRLWDARSGQAVLAFSNPSEAALSVLSPDKKTLATTTLSGQVLIWDAASGQLRKAWQGHGDLISDVVFTPDGKILATVSRDGSTKLWDVEKVQLSGTLHVGRNADHVVFSPDGKLLVVVGEGNKKEIRVWDVATALPVFNITEHGREILGVEFSTEGHLVSSSDDAVNVWDVINRTHLAKLDNASFPAKFSKDGRTLATGGLKGTVVLWDVASH